MTYLKTEIGFLIESSAMTVRLREAFDAGFWRRKVVATPDTYSWSSYPARMSQIEPDRLDRDPCYMALATTESERQATRATRGTVQRCSRSGLWPMMMSISSVVTSFCRTVDICRLTSSRRSSTACSACCMSARRAAFSVAMASAEA